MFEAGQIADFAHSRAGQKTVETGQNSGTNWTNRDNGTKPGQGGVGGVYSRSSTEGIPRACDAGFVPGQEPGQKSGHTGTNRCESGQGQDSPYGPSSPGPAGKVEGVRVVLAIDPGTRESGYVQFDGRRVLSSGVLANALLLQMLEREDLDADTLAIEKIEAMGMAVGAETFETVHWSGRFHQAWRDPAQVKRITRRQVKLGLCGNMRAKDPNIRQALIDMLGAPGTKKAPGPTYGVSSHAWAALAVAVIAVGADKLPSPFEDVPY